MTEFDLERLSLHSTVRIIRRKGHECVDLNKRKGLNPKGEVEE